MEKGEHIQDIRQLSLDQLISQISDFGEKPFRAKQIYEWLWKKSATDFDEMTNLSLSLRELLRNKYLINKVIVSDEQISNDRTIKSGFKLYDENIVEGVLIPTEKRITACISSQVGCSLSCTFCATGFLERKRNLEIGEIYDQVVLINKQAEQNYGTPLSNVVLMGMGEPLLNYANVLQGIDRITSSDGLNMSSKRITLSTAGIAKMIKKLADDHVKFNLALSLHAADDEKRNSIMPINETNSLESLKEALMYFYSRTKNQITLEYIAFKDFNVGLDDARNLARFASNLPCKINIIEYNPIDQANFGRANANELDAFIGFLEKKGLIINVRRSRGKDIDAACGQLANKSSKVVDK
ncbi:MAG: 23S rRNA (adenine(2503)-C(2))-methyltransferase RlmN [Cyclobacteriaceae bacterium]|nr:23S rRNA (adenine(2503)-C(2))-methyltransferase RlmN [Cyclobacteriaceae bacterium]MCK5704002.1 23S rRNA (adenine(2503)-C(2))-methyltransferase RlmN [Cyclobacteriaceae bacterium]